LLPTFRAGGRDRLLIFELLFRELERLGYPFEKSLRNRALQMYHGDMVALGRGEVLVPD
jgi:hypothetical protein